MAIFANASYSDPVRALTIKALEKRQADLAAAQAKEELPTSMPSPWQGLAHVAGSIGDAMQQSRIENAVAARRADLAKLISGVDPAKGPDPTQLAGIMGADPDLGTKYLEMAQRAREAEATRAGEMERLKLSEAGATGRTGMTTASSEKLAAERIAAEQAAAAKLAENQSLLEQQKAEERRQAEADQAARTAAENEKNRLAQAEQGQPEMVRMQKALNEGRITPADFEAWKRKQTMPSATDQKANLELKSGYIESASALDQLREADELLGKGIYTGAGGGIQQGIGRWAPERVGKALGADPETTKRTERYNTIMNSEAISDMARRLKGATTEKEMAAFVAINNDPNATLQTKQAALRVLLSKVEAHVSAQGDAIRASGGELPKVSSYKDAQAAKQLSPEDKAASVANAKAAIARNPARRDEILKTLKANGIDIEGL